MKYWNSDSRACMAVSLRRRAVLVLGVAGADGLVGPLEQQVQSLRGTPSRSADFERQARRHGD